MRAFAHSKDTAALSSFLNYLQNLSAHSLHRFADSLACEFPEELPISAKTEEISEALKQHQAVIVCGSTGSGKTTQLPKIALRNGFGRTGRIGCTQPRRIAASALARRVASETGCQCGGEVGYKVRFDDHTDRKAIRIACIVENKNELLSSVCRYCNAKAMRRLGFFDQAERTLLELLNSDQLDDLYVKYELARMYEDAENVKQAQRRYQEIYAYSPDFLDVRERLLL